MNEVELRSAVSSSQKDGFRLVFQQYQNYVYSIVWGHIRKTGTREDAEECVSDVFADVFLHFGDIREGALHGYIGTVAKRKAIDRFRRLSAERGVPTDDEELANIPSDVDIAEDTETADRNVRLYEAIKQLGEPDSTIVIQKYYYERKSAEIAADVGMTPSAVRVRLNRALKRLKKLIAE